MIPSEISTDSPQSEKEIFRRFKDLTPPEWTAIHSQGFVLHGDRGQPVQDGEIDFLLVVPQRGYLILEVKGGGVRYRHGKWSSTNRKGETFPIKDPAEQARRGAHAVDEFLANRAWFKANRIRPRFGWGVVFPDVDLPKNTGLALPRDHVIDRIDCTHFDQAIERLMAAQDLTRRTYPSDFASELIGAVCPPIDTRVPLAKWFAEEEEVQRRFTEEQIGLLDRMAGKSRLAIEGCAGSGKTIVAMEKAKRLSNQGIKVLFLCFNKPLARELRLHATDYPISTFHDYCLDFARRAGRKAVVPHGGRKKSRFYTEELPLMFLEASANHTEDRFDAVVVDEGQDFEHDWWDCVREMLKDPEQGIWYVFFDPLQDIYGRGIPRILDIDPYPLRYNCRNSGRIAEFCSDISKSIVETFPGTPPGLEVQRFQATNVQSLKERLIRIVSDLVNQERVSPESMVLLSTRSRKSSVLKKLKNLGQLTLAPLGAALTPNQLRFDSLFKFKGLEADVVLLLDEGHPRTSTPNHLYVGASRARHLLVFAQFLPPPRSDYDS